jgi:DNA (cytosine-5)-methyltransferase 1
MNVLDLFSGIGGFSLGLERAGMRTVAFCEIEPFCRAVLKKHWPHVPCYDDIRTLTADRLRADGIAVDVICGGFPCQDISVAGKGAGIEGSRSGLWSEYARLIGELRPRYIIVENVAALLGRGLDRVLGDLATLGYDAEWHCIPASAIGAPHRRDRLWLVANPCRPERRPVDSACGSVQRSHGVSQGEKGAGRSSTSGEALADADSRHEYRRSSALQMGWGRIAREAAADGDAGRAQWSIEPDVGRVAHGVSARVDRLCGLGNAVVPQIPEIIGRAIMNTQPR